MSEINVIVRTADQTRKAEVKMSGNNTGADIIDAAISNWSLPTDTQYSLVNVSSGSDVNSRSTLQGAGVQSGHVLEVAPVLVAGTRW